MDAIEKTSSRRAPTETTRRRYDRHARFYDLEQRPIRLLTEGLRKSLWAEVSPDDRVLEVGVGTGLNIPHYPPGSRVTAIDISPRMLERARARAQALEAAVDLVLMDVQELELRDASFDVAVATFTFCSVPDPVAGLEEVLRVLKPGGRLVLLEHVRSANRVLGKMMDWLNPIAVRATGANINRRTAENVSKAGFEIQGISRRLGGIVQIIRAGRP